MPGPFSTWGWGTGPRTSSTRPTLPSVGRFCFTTGLVLAALIVGASLLMRIETRSRLFGYPTLAILCFMTAAAGAIWLLVTIFLQDRKDSEKR